MSVGHQQSGDDLGKNNRKPRERELSLEEQLRDLDANQPPGPLWFDGKLLPPSADRMAYVRRRQDIVSRIRRRQMKALTDPGPDPSGNYSPSPLAARGHVIEVAPKDLKASADSISFPKRTATQRMIDRYKAQGLLTARQWRAGDRLWRIWRDSGRDPNLIGNYSPDAIRGAADPDAKMIGRTEAVADWEECRRLCGVLGFGVLVDVVIWDKAASDWAATKRTPVRDCATVGMAFLRLGLDTLAAHFRY